MPWSPPNAGLEPIFRKEAGGSGQKARAGRQPESRPANSCSDETPVVSRGGSIAVKIEGGGGVKAPPGCARREPGGAGSPRGARIGRGLNHHDRHRTHRGEQGPEDEGASAGHRRRRPTAGGHEQPGETPDGSAVRDNPLKGKPWTWQRGETNPQRFLAEEAVEGVRNAEGGT
jgi:hypothetical protein